MIYIGIDPGLRGAVAAIVDDQTVLLSDTPTIPVQSGKKTKNQYHLAAMRSILVDIQNFIAGEPCQAAIELVHSMPGQGVSSSFSFGFGCGVWEGMLAALQIPYTKVTPQRWKKHLMDGMGKEKAASLARAIQFFPQAACKLTRLKDEGRAEALLIAEHLRRASRT